jgi:glyoxylase-like metal-dependent hydrolase (beta-lactamase superfamily II)
MVRFESHGDVSRFEFSSVASRVAGYAVNVFVVRGVMVDCAFPRAREAFADVLRREKPRGLFITHHHEDHAGNVEWVARAAVPIAASPATIERVRAPKPIKPYRRITWGSAQPLVSSVVRYEYQALSLIPAPGHCADHHVVWDANEGTLFGGDLYLGVKVRIAHPSEDPRLLARTLRKIAALSPARLFDAHRGFVPNPTELLIAKAEWTEETIGEIERRIARGDSDDQIRRDLFGGESLPGYFSGGDYARINFVRAVRNRDTGQGTRDKGTAAGSW